MNYNVINNIIYYLNKTHYKNTCYKLFYICYQTKIKQYHLFNNHSIIYFQFCNKLLCIIFIINIGTKWRHVLHFDINNICIKTIYEYNLLLIKFIMKEEQSYY